MTEQERLDKNRRIAEKGKATREKRKHQVCKTFDVKIQMNSLSAKQKEQLKMIFVEGKWIYNDIISHLQTNNLNSYDTKIKSVNVKLPDGTFENRPLKFIGSSLKQSIRIQISWAIAALAKTKEHGRRVGRLKFKSELKTISFLQNGISHKIVDSTHVKLQRISGKIKVNGMKQFLNIPNVEITTFKLVNKPDGYHIMITVCFPIPDEQPIYIAKEIGIDMGIKTGITLSNGVKFNCLIEESERLKMLQRKLSRQVKGSKNYNKTLNKIRKEYQKIINKKNDAANKVIHYILQFENIYMQDEMVSNWQKGLFGRVVQQSILGRVKPKLVNHPRINVLDRSAPTTQYCPQCGKNTKHSLDKREYTCEHCGYHDDDRDVHAAKNMIRMVKILKESSES